MMKLYYHPVSTTSRPIMLFAADHGLELEYRLVDLFQGEQLQPAFAAINPNCLVPVLEDGDFRLTESSAILKYLADQIGSPAYPVELRERARVNERMDWFNTALSRELGYGFVYPQVFPDHKRPDPQAQQQTLAWARPRVRRWLTVLDEDLIGPNHDFVCGDAMTLADYQGMGLLTLGEAAHLDYSHWRNISRWLARIKAQPSFAKVHEAFETHVKAPCAGLAFEPL
jgi:glutathione S-transferase